MKLQENRSRWQESGNVLLTVSILLGVSGLMVIGLYSYSWSQDRLNARNNDYLLATYAAEAATEKVLSQVTTDFRNYGDGYLQQHLDTYRGMIPLTSESPVWANFDFEDLSHNDNKVDVQFTSLAGFGYVGGQYGPLQGWNDRLRILSTARPLTSLDGVVGSVYQDINLTRIPVFQYAIFYNVTLEFTPLPTMVIAGPVHCNTNIYMDPAGSLTFQNDTTSSGTIVMGPNPVSPLGALGGTTTFNAAHDSGVSVMSLPIGTNGSPASVQQLLMLPPVGESAASSMGEQRYYNKADLVIIVSNNTVLAESGLATGFAYQIPSNELSFFFSTNTSFYNKREAKTVKVLQLDVGNLLLWNATNVSIRPHLALQDVRTVYIADQRTLASGNETGVRLIDGATLPPQGLTVATPSPLYIQGNYNVTALGLGTTNTIGTQPASIAADAITILSGNWADTNGSKTLSNRIARDTTVNAAFLTGIVATTSTSDSGGVENFPRFLEDWSANTFTYNGSMVCMFYSSIATGLWKGIGSTYDIYNPPNRNWGLDQNFQYRDKLPPSTPCLTILVRSTWRMPTAYTTNTLAGF